MKQCISCDCQCKFNSATCNWKQKWNNKTSKCECKNYRKCEKNYWWKLAHVFVRITSILKSYLYFSDYVWWNCYCY